MPSGTPALVISLIKLALLPLTMGVGYEILMLAGKHDNIITRIISAPGMWVQKITTKEPTLDMLEVAIVSIKCALRDDFPEFSEFYNERAWEKTAEHEGADEAEKTELTSAEEDTVTQTPQDVAEGDESDGVKTSEGEENDA
jgi:hypothetical protein